MRSDLASYSSDAGLRTPSNRRLVTKCQCGLTVHFGQAPVPLITPTACALFMQTSVDDVQSQPPADQLPELLREQPERSEEEGRSGGEGEAAGEVNGSAASPNENINSGSSAETPAVDEPSQPTTPGPSNTQPSSKSNAAPPAAVKRYSSATVTKAFMMKATASPNSGSVSGSQSSKNANAGSSATCEFSKQSQVATTLPDFI